MNLDDDVAAAIDRERTARGLGLSEAVNALIRKGLRESPPRRSKRFEQRTVDLGVMIDVTSTAEAIEILEGPLAR